MIDLKIGIFGGTFDPPHKGHISAAKAAVKALDLDKLLVIPDAQPPHKSLPADAPEAQVRLEMTRDAMKGVRNTIVSDIEIKRGGTSYTIDTINAITEKFPEAKLYLLLGTDMFMCFETWRDFKGILDKATIAVFARKEGEEDLIHSAIHRFRSQYGASICMIRHSEVDISSTDLRALLGLRRGREYLSERVYGDIIRLRLYGAQPEFQWLRERADEMLDPGRVPHVRGCEEEAQRLAMRWGADVDKAREAAILHDITKKEGMEGQLLLCSKYGIIPDSAELESSKLLHAKTGAAVARAEFGCDDQVYSAIFWHTTGRAGMTLLEKVMYMADYIEPNRDFEGVEELRELAYSDLDRALKMGFEMSLQDINERRMQVHPNTLAALEWVSKLIRDRDT